MDRCSRCNAHEPTPDTNNQNEEEEAGDDDDDNGSQPQSPRPASSVGGTSPRDERERKPSYGNLGGEREAATGVGSPGVSSPRLSHTARWSLSSGGSRESAELWALNTPRKLGRRNSAASTLRPLPLHKVDTLHRLERWALLAAVSVFYFGYVQAVKPQEVDCLSMGAHSRNVYGLQILLRGGSRAQHERCRRGCHLWRQRRVLFPVRRQHWTRRPECGRCCVHGPCPDCTLAPGPSRWTFSHPERPWHVVLPHAGGQRGECVRRAVQPRSQQKVQEGAAARELRARTQRCSATGCEGPRCCEAHAAGSEASATGRGAGSTPRRPAQGCQLSPRCGMGQDSETADRCG